MSRRLLREENEARSSVNADHIPVANAVQIVGGGCYHGPSSWEPPNFKSPPNLQPASRRWIVIAILALIVIVAFGLWRYLSRK